MKIYGDNTLKNVMEIKRVGTKVKFHFYKEEEVSSLQESPDCYYSYIASEEDYNRTCLRFEYILTGKARIPITVSGAFIDYCQDLEIEATDLQYQLVLCIGLSGYQDEHPEVTELIWREFVKGYSGEKADKLLTIISLQDLNRITYGNLHEAYTKLKQYGVMAYMNNDFDLRTKGEEKSYLVEIRTELGVNKLEIGCIGGHSTSSRLSINIEYDLDAEEEIKSLLKGIYLLENPSEISIPTNGIIEVDNNFQGVTVDDMSYIILNKLISTVVDKEFLPDESTITAFKDAIKFCEAYREYVLPYTEIPTIPFIKASGIYLDSNIEKAKQAEAKLKEKLDQMDKATTNLETPVWNS